MPYMGEMESLRRYYGVPAKRGARVVFTGLKYPVAGRITSARDHKLWIRTDDGRRFGPLHPTWEVEYVDLGHVAQHNPESCTGDVA